MRCFAAADFFSSISSTKRWKKRKSVESKVRSGTLSPRGSQSGRIALPAEKCSVSTAKEDSEETLEGEKRQKAKDAEKSASTASASAASLNGDFETTTTKTTLRSYESPPIPMPVQSIDSFVTHAFVVQG